MATSDVDDNAQTRKYPQHHEHEENNVCAVKTGETSMPSEYSVNQEPIDISADDGDDEMAQEGDIYDHNKLSNEDKKEDGNMKNQNRDNVPTILISNENESPKLPTRKISNHRSNKHMFTVVNYGDSEVGEISNASKENSETNCNVDSRVPQKPKANKKQTRKTRKSSKQNIQKTDSDSDIGDNSKMPSVEIPEIIISSEADKKKRRSSFLQQFSTLDSPQLSNFNHFKKNTEHHDIPFSHSDDEGILHRPTWRAKLNKSKTFLNTADQGSCSDISTQSLKAARTWNAPRSMSIYNIASALSSPIKDVIKRGKIFGKRKQDRLILKDGTINLAAIRVEGKGRRFFQDLFATLIDIKWIYMILLLAAAFLGTWVGFAFIWWAICHFQIKRGGPECVSLVNDFESALLFSVETQHTIGYGTRAVSKECPLAIFFVMLQSLIGITMACVTTGLVFAKFATPGRKSETLLFSKHAVIHEKENQRYLSFRVGDIRQNHMIQVIIQAIMFSHEVDDDDPEEAPFQQHNLHVESEAENCFFLAWPIEIRHKIDETSPLWEISEEDLINADFEIVVVFEGCITSTGQSTQICTSYLPSEILWAAKLEPLITGRKESGKYLINYMNFDDTCSVEMSSDSARDAFMNPRKKKVKDINANHFSTLKDNKHRYSMV